MPAATAEYGSTCDEPTARTALVEQFCSWSACRMNRTSSARSTRGSGSYFSSVILYIMLRKLPADLRALSRAGAVLLVVGVRENQAAARALAPRVGLVLQLGHLVHHVEEVARVLEVVV